MLIHIRDDNDIIRFEKHLADKTKRELRFITRLPGCRGYMNIGEFKGDLFLEFDINVYNRKYVFQLEWNYSVEIFIDKTKDFDFREETNIFGQRKLFLIRPPNFDRIKENSLIEELINICYDRNYNFFGKKYGLK